MGETIYKPFRATLVLEQTPEGDLFIESYLNGQRSREKLTKGFEMFEMLECLAAQRRVITSREEREALRRAERQRNLHRQVWSNVAYGINGSKGFGEHFADRTVNGNMGKGPNCKPAQSAKPKAPKLPLTEDEFVF